MEKHGRYHHGDLRSALIEASLQLIEDGGVQALSLRGAAKRAGVSPAAPYHHFESRAALLAAIAEQGFLLLRDQMLCAREEAPDTAESIACCGRAYVRFAREHTAHFRVMFRPELADRNEFPALGAVSAEVFELLVQTVKNGQMEGSIPPGDHEPYVLLGWSVAHGLSSLLIDGPLGSDFDKIELPEDQLAEVVTGALTAVLRDGAQVQRGSAGPNGKSLEPQESTESP